VVVLNLFIILVAVLGIYSIAMSRIADQLAPTQQRWYFARFTLGLLAALAIFVPSPDLFGPEYRFTVNTVQFLLAVDVAPLLLLLGIPRLMLLPLLGWEKLGRFLKNTLLVGLVSSAIIIAWHVPVLFEAASRNLPTWILKQFLLLVAGLLLWWPVAGPLTEWRTAYPVQLVYLFILRIPMVILGTFFIFANELIYTSRSFAVEICAPASIPDQQIGGLVMSVVGGLIGFTVLSIVFFTWLSESNAAELN
jgi:putative membrane protein